MSVRWMVPAVWVLELLAGASCFGQSGTYRLANPCPEGFCEIDGLTDDGLVAGKYRGQFSFVYSADKGRTEIPLPRGEGLPTTGMTIRGINRAGVIAGWLDADFRQHAFAAAPPYTEFLLLNPVFGWPSGMVTGINDYGQIVGTGTESPTFHPTYPFFPPEYRVIQLLDINNAAQMLGICECDGPDSAKYFLYTPGKGVAAFDFPFGSSHVRGLNNAGHLLLEDALENRTYIIRPDGRVPLPAGYFWADMNDSDEVVGSSTGAADPVLHSEAQGLVHLAPLVEPEGPFQADEWSISTANFINNRGEIVAYGNTPASRGTARILIPVR